MGEHIFYTSLVIAIFLFLLVWATNGMRKQAVKDWETLRYLQEKAGKVSTKEEIEEFHKEFLEKSKKINNKFIFPHLREINGYLRGLYKQYNKQS